MICALCKKRAANKKNTHYLTDGIIRSALNWEGSNEREKGFYFGVNSDEQYMDVNIQRNTPAEKVEESFGRRISDAEIENAKKIPFSVDYVFCSDCEKLFTEIETEFLANTLPLFRNANLTGQQSIAIDSVSARLFFYLQIWRSSVCADNYQLPEDAEEHLREMIANYKIVNEAELESYPLSVTYLETLGGPAAFTHNFVGYTNEQNPYIIFMNDFVIQFYESPHAIRYREIYGLNQKTDYETYIYCQVDEFACKVISDTDRQKFWKRMLQTEKSGSALQSYIDYFTQEWVRACGRVPTEQLIKEYLQTSFEETEAYPLKYTEGNIAKLTAQFIERKGQEKQ